MQTQLARVLAARGEVAEATQVLARMGSAADPSAMGRIAGAWAETDPQAAADWAIAQPAGPLQNNALASVVGTWARDNPRETAVWLAQFPAGDARDRSVATFLYSAVSRGVGSPERGAEFDQWFDLIGDPWQRTRVAVFEFTRRKESDPAGARAWLTALPNTDAELIRVTLRDERY